MLSLPPSSAPSTSLSSDLEVPTNYKYIGADHCGVCRLPLQYDHIRWSQGLVDGYTCRCGRSSSEPSPPEPTPEEAPTPQLACCTLPKPESNDDEDSEVNYKVLEESNCEHQPLIPPLGYITNNPEHPFYYHIYVRNPLYRANQVDWTHKRLIVAPFIKYSADYTMVMGSAGRGMETRSCPIQIDRRVPTHHPITPLKWKHLRNGNEREFSVNTALAQINDPKYHGEINRYRGLSNLQDTLEKLMRDAQGRVMEVMKELVVVESQLNLCKKRLEISNAYEELEHHFR